MPIANKLARFVVALIALMAFVFGMLLGLAGLVPLLGIGHGFDTLSSGGILSLGVAIVGFTYFLGKRMLARLN